MNMRFVGGALALTWALCTAPAWAGGWDVACGKEGQAPCSLSKAKFERPQKGLCPEGQFWDMINGGTCWSCPAGTGRTILWGVNTDKACEKVSTTDFRRAIEHGKATGIILKTDCPSGQFWDIVDGNCHSCPDGYSMQVLEHVHGDKKCAKGIPASYFRATSYGPPCGEGKLWDMRNGGECWSCPNGFVRTIAPVTSDWACEYKGIGGGTGLIGCQDGLVSIRNVCLKQGECGKVNQRPCQFYERIPSCNEGLKEDFKQNLCLPLRPGETPFTGGLSSLGGYLGSRLELECKGLLGNIPINWEGNLGVGARCGRDVAAGFACVMARDIATGIPDLINSLFEKVPEGASLAEQMNAAANASPCKELAERFAKATRHNKATGQYLQTDCPGGQFWDPDGFCYSCPANYSRTFYPVTHERACTDQIGGNLARFACGAYKGVANKFGGPLSCTIEVLENGSVFERKLDLSKANQVACMATGELGYYMVRTAFEGGKAAATGDISGLLTTIGKAAGAATKAKGLDRMMECAKQK